MPTRTFGGYAFLEMGGPRRIVTVFALPSLSFANKLITHGPAIQDFQSRGICHH